MFVLAPNTASRRGDLRRALVVLLTVAHFLTGMRAEAQSRHVQYVRVEKSIVEGRASTFPSNSADQIAALQRQFGQIGLGPRACKTGGPVTALVCTIPGRGPGAIAVVGFLSSRKRQGQAEAERASLALLPLLAESSISVERENTYILAALDGDELGRKNGPALLGSLRQVSGVQEISAVLFLSEIGRADPTVACFTNGSSLQTAYRESAFMLHLQLDGNNESACPALPNQLRKSHIPTILLTSPSYYFARIVTVPGRASGPLRKVDEDSYYATYHLVCIYLAILDHSPAPDENAVDESAPLALETRLTLTDCVERFRASHGFPPIAESKPLAAFAGQRTATLADRAKTDTQSPPNDLDAQLQRAGIASAAAAEVFASIDGSDSADLCSRVVREPLFQQPGNLTYGIAVKVDVSFFFKADRRQYRRSSFSYSGTHPTKPFASAVVSTLQPIRSGWLS